MLRKGVILALAWVLVACAAPAPAPIPLPLPANVRPTLDRQWVDAAGAIRWPPADGFTAPPVLIVLPPGTLIDRFGDDKGRFFSPKGAAFAARALPYVCTTLRYTAYRVTAPIPVWAGRAAPWFDQRGGATQFQTDAAAERLQLDRQIEALPQAAADQPC